jgi:hypothetical protein
MSTDELVKLFPARARRRWARQKLIFLCFLMLLNALLDMSTDIRAILMSGFRGAWRGNRWHLSRNFARRYVFSFLVVCCVV